MTRRPQHTQQLHVVANHLLVRRGEAFDLLDTGVPASMDAPSVVSDELGVPVGRLIGCAELARTPIRIDWPARTITWGAPRHGAAGVKVPLRMSPLGVPLIPLDTETGFVEAVLDTGAALSYCPPDYVQGLRPMRRGEDFLPGFGRFEVEIHEVEIEVMGLPLTLEVAVLPPLLRTVLAMIAPDGWILGAALFRDRVVTLDLQQSLAYIGEASVTTTASTTGPDGTEAVARGTTTFLMDLADDEDVAVDDSDRTWSSTRSPTEGVHSGIAYSIDFDTSTRASGEARVRVAITFRGSVPSNADRPVDLALVLDRSGSMNGRAIESVRQAASDLVSRLPNGSRAALVSFADDARLDVPLTHIGESTTGPLQAMIGSIDAFGSTALERGWRLGRSALSLGGDSLTPERHPLSMRRIMLVTDGRANVGERSPSVLASMCRDAALGGVSTTTIGFGDRYDEDLLRVMADAGDGSTWFVQGPDRVAEVLDAELQAMRSVSALRVQLNIAATDARMTGVWGGLGGEDPQTGRGDSPRQTVLIGELSPLAPRAVVLEFTLPRDATGVATTLAEVQLTAVAPDGLTPILHRFGLEWDGVLQSDAAARAAWLDLQFAAAQERAIALADAQRLHEAAALLQRCVTTLDRQHEAVRALIGTTRDVLVALIARLEGRHFDRRDRKRALQHAYDRRTGKQTLFDW